jgi:hypothetical protein
MTWEAFKDYWMEPVRLSKTEEKIIALISAGDAQLATQTAVDSNFLIKKDNELKRTLECLELEDKMKRLGLTVPWKK